MKKRSHTAYVHYYFEHPKEFKDSPPISVSGNLWIKKIQEGEVKIDDVDRISQRLREKWKRYHREKAKALGFDIDLERLENDLNWLAIENRVAVEMFE